jgi:hypothetical protein
LRNCVSYLFSYLRLNLATLGVSRGRTVH